MSVPRIRLSRAAAHSVVGGHPWVFREEPARHEPGTVVELADGRGVRLGWALADEGPIAFRILGRGPRMDVGELVRLRVREADALRRRLTDPATTDALRIVAGAGDGLDGLVVDRYGPLAVLRMYARAWEPWLEHVVGAISGLGWCTTVWRRYGVARVDGRTGGDTLWGPAAPERLVVQEHGMRMLVRPWTGQKTGLFLDQREHRALVRGWARDRHVANLFGYTGGFSVAAALGGATRVVTVDVAADALEDARENFRLNDLDPDAHGFEATDAFTWRPAAPVDLLVLDPPSLAHDRRAEKAAVAAYRNLHAHHGAHVAEGGLLATSSCTARVSTWAWRAAVTEGLAATGAWSWHWSSAEPPDHPTALAHAEGPYLKFSLLRRRDRR
jgi:23S rRNA (cytosine1962-C5)-methyltransferase